MANPFPELDPFAEPRRVVPRGEVEGWLAEEMRKERDSEVRRTIVTAPPAEQVARETRLAREANVSPAMIAGRADEVERARNADKLIGLAERYPAIGRFAAANPRGAVAAQDDAKSLGLLGEAFDGLKRLGKAAVGQLDAGRLWAAGMFWDTLATADEALTTITYPVAAARATAASAFGINDDPDEDAARRQAFLRGAGRQLSEARAERSERDKFGNYWVDATLAGLQSAPAMVAAAVLRNPTAAASVLGGGTAAEGYQSALRSGASKGAAIRYGVTTGFAEGALEKMPISGLGEMIANKTPWGKAFVRQLATEMPAEQVTTILQNLSAYAYLPENAGKTLGDFLAEMPGAALDTALATAGGVTATTGTIAAARRATDATAKVVARVQEVRRAKAERQFIDKAEKAATGSKLRQRDPEALRALLKEQAEDAGARNVFIPAEAIREYRQSDGYDADMDPFDQGGFEEAMIAGGDYVIPIEDALTDLVGTPAWEAVKDDLRLTGGGISNKEAAAFESEMDALIEQMSDQAAEQERADAPRRDQRERLIDHFAGQFGESYTAPVARKFAEVMVQRAMTRAERTGMDLEEALTGVSVKQVLPEGVAQAVKADQIDLVVNAMRQGKPVEVGEGESLLQWLRARGGVNDTGGDLKSIGAPANILRPFDPQAAMGGVTGAGDFGLDSTLREAVDAEFFPELAGQEVTDLDPQILIDAIAREVGGEPVYRVTRTDPYRQAGEELRGILADAGLDPDTASDREIRDVIARLDAGEDGGRAFEQADLPATLDIDGVARPTLNSEGMPLGRDEAAARAFWAWFGDSKVVDAEGRPLVVYHGTPGSAIDAFDEAKAGKRDVGYFGKGFYFTTDKDTADEYSWNANYTRQGQTESIYLRIENPFIYSLVNENSEARTIAAVREISPTSQATTTGIKWSDVPQWTKDVQAAGHDAVINQEKGGGLEIVAFSPAQIKSVNNRGTFDPADARILFQEARGRIVFEGAKRTIELFQSRNLSTPLHELSHMWLEELMFDASLPNAPEQVKGDAEAVKAYLAANGHAMEGSTIPPGAHELWARSGERYFMEGKSPSSALVRLFESFRAWLIGIYRVVDNLRAPITPEIREVFDRLIATDQEIAEARERQALGQLFKDAATIGMSEAEFAAYQQQVDDARAGAHASLIGKTMRVVRRRETKRYRKAREAVVKEEAERIDGSPLYRAISMMRETRVSKEWIEDTLGMDAPGLLPVRVPPLHAEGGTDPQVIAELSGYGSAREMLESLIGAERAHRQAKGGGDKRSMRQRAIDTAADAEMHRRYGDPLNDGSIEREALAAVHSEMQGEVIASELRVLARRTGNRPTPYRIARAWARAKVRQGIVADEASAGAIQRYARNAAKAGRAAEEAMLKQDVGEAFRQKQFQMMNNALVAEAKEAADEVDIAVRRMDKIARARTRKSVDQDYLEQAQALLEAVDLRRRSQVGIDRKDKWSAWAEAREAEGHTVVMPERFEWTGTNWTRIPVDALLALDEQIKQIMYLGRKKQELLTAKRDRELAVVASAIQDTIRAQRPDVIKDWRNRNTLGQRLRSSVKGLFAVHRKMASLARQIDGGADGGPLVRALILPMTDRYNWEAEQHTAANLKLSEILKPYLGRTAMGRNKMTSGSVFFPSIGHAFNLGERMIIVANMGNEGNFQRLLDGEQIEDGFNWSVDGLLAIRDSLTKEQMDAVQAIWDFFESYKPLIAAKERSVNGVEPEWVEPAPVETAHGTYRGGYFPIKYDPARSTKAQQQSDADEAKRQMQGAFTASTTRRSFVKERADKVQKRPLRYSFSTVTSGITEIIHDLAFHEYLIDANRLMRHPKVGDEIRKRFGPEVLKQFTEGLEDVAVGNAPAANAWEGALNYVRFGATIAGLGWNLKTALLQPFGITQSIVRVGPKWIARGLREWTIHPAALPQRVREKSAFMRERSRTMSREVSEIQNRVQGRTASRQFIEASFFYMIVKMQMTVDLPTWWGAYEKAIAADEIEAEAVLLADQAVKDAQGGGQIGDLARIQRGGPLMKLWTNFYSFFSTTYNLTAESVARTKFTRPSDVVAFMGDMVLLYSIPAMMNVALAAAFSAMKGEDDDEENFAAALAGEQISYAMGTMVGLREMTGLGQSVAEWTTGMDVRQYDGPYGGPPGLRVLQELDRFGKQAAQGELDRALRKSGVNAAGILLHLPSGQINKTLDGAMALEEGDSENPLVLASGT